MLVHWVKVIWAKDGGSGTPWGPTIFFSEKKSISLKILILILCFLTLELKTRNVFPSEVQIISTIKEFIAPIMATINALNILLWQLNATNSRLSIMPPRVAEI